MKKLLAAVIIVFGTVFVAVFASAKQTREPSKAQVLKREIAAKLLYDGLHLTKEQSGQLASLLEEATARRRQRKGPEQTALLEQARDEIYRTGTISDETRQDMLKRRTDRKQGNQRPRLGEDLQSILSAEQLAFLKEFDPMKQLGLPGRRGHQARGERQKNKIRSLSDDAYRERKEQVLARASQRLSGKTNREERLKTLERKLDTLRSGTDEDIRRLSEESPRLSRMAKRRDHRKSGKRQRRREIKLLLSPEFQRLLSI